VALALSVKEKTQSTALNCAKVWTLIFIIGQKAGLLEKSEEWTLLKETGGGATCAMLCWNLAK
jgi:hypothetical protein